MGSRIRWDRTRVFDHDNDTTLTEKRETRYRTSMRRVDMALGVVVAMLCIWVAMLITVIWGQ